MFATGIYGRPRVPGRSLRPALLAAKRSEWRPGRSHSSSDADAAGESFGDTPVVGYQDQPQGPSARCDAVATDQTHVQVIHSARSPRGVATVGVGAPRGRTGRLSVFTAGGVVTRDLRGRRPPRAGAEPRGPQGSAGARQRAAYGALTRKAGGWRPRSRSLCRAVGRLGWRPHQRSH